ncbi:MAG: plasmid recombination protein, partial [Lachnospiraceae bacterium]|nr:plasmid recombination protein [Lachnospiraceae bacterium]
EKAMAKNMSVARIARYTSANIGKAERHNERKNDTYENLNVDPERIRMNVHFKDPGKSSFMEILAEKEERGEVSRKNLRQDATLFNEMIIDVNTIYFEEHGGYEFAKQFYEEAFHFAEKKYGSENIVSAVMHADEINQAATEEFGHPVYHYHLHVIAIPIVKKEVRWTKRCKDPELVGTVKEVINQISHSKKWESKTPELDELGNPILRANGKPKFIKSYSILQDELFEHMQEAGFRDFERGERGSTAEHLSSLQYQYQKDLERKAELEKMIEIETLKYEPARNAFQMYQQLDSIGKKKSITGKIIVDETDFKKLKALAKEGLSSRSVIAQLKEDVNYYKRRFAEKAASVEKLQDKLKEMNELCRPYLDAMKRFPEKMKTFLDDLLKIPEKEKQLTHETPKVKTKKKKRDEWSR